MGDDFEGLTLDQLDELAESVVTCLEENPEDPTCLGDAYRLARSCQALVDAHKFVVERLNLVSEQLSLVRQAKKGGS